MSRPRLATFALIAAATAITVAATVTPSEASAQKAVRIAPTKGVIRTLAAGPNMVAWTVRGRDKVHQLHVIKGRGRAKKVGEGIGPDFAPDGSEVVFYNDNKGDNLFWVTTITPEGKNAFDMGVQGKDLTAARPIYSPDSQAIVYTSSQGTYIIPKVGQFTRRITTTVLRDPTWSPDGTKVLYERKGGGISTLDVVTGISRDLTPNFHGFHPRFSPDGKKILYAHDLGIYVMDLDKGKRKKITEGERAEWTNMGEGIIAMRTTGKVTGKGPTARPDYSVHWLALDGDEDDAKTLAKRAHELDVAPDGRTVYFTVMDKGVYKVRLPKLPGEGAAASRVKSVRKGAEVPAKALPKIEKKEEPK